MRLKDCLLQVSESTRKTALEFSEIIENLKNNNSDKQAVKGFRASMGIYEHREQGKFMTRIRFGAGLILPTQLRGVCDLADKYGNEKLHFTTRQAIQLHDLPEDDLSKIQVKLLTLNLATKGGGGNTIRNIGASARAGIAKDEVFDIRPYVIATNEYLLQFDESFTLPRKYKIAFAGSKNDDAFASVADLGFFAKRKEGKNGFEVYAGGGLGRKPTAAVLIESWVEAKDCLIVAEAIRQVFVKHGDREHRHKARLRFVLERLGEKEFVDIYQKEKVIIQEKKLPGFIPEFRYFPSPYQGRCGKEYTGNKPGCVIPEKETGFYTISINLSLGNIPTSHARILADIAEEHGDGLLRLGQSQNVIIGAISGDKIEEICSQLQKLSPNLLGDTRAEIVACTGARICNLGICFSPEIALEIDKQLAKDKVDANPKDIKIRISGCPNCCANHPVAEIGLEGRAKKIDGELVQFYQLTVGGKLQPGKVIFGEKKDLIPATEIPKVISELIIKKQ